MSNRTRKIPTDEHAEKAYAACMKIAADAGILTYAYSGIATLAIPSEQRKAGVRDDTLAMGLFEVERPLS